MSPLLTAKIELLHFPGQNEPSLRNIDLSFSAGEFIILVGPAGSGKSALCQCLAGVVPLFEPGTLRGDVRFDGQSILSMRLSELAGKIALVRDDPQDQLFCATLEEDLAFGPCNLMADRLDVKRRIRVALKLVGLPGYEKRKPESLSGGESQRVVLASFLTLEPDILILDRANDQVDRRGWDSIRDELLRLCREPGKTVIMVDERFSEFLDSADRILVMNEGTVVFDGSPSGYRHLSAVASPESCRNQSKRIAGLVRLETRNHPQTTDRPLGTDSEPIISVEDASFEYPDTGFGLHEIHLEIGCGEFVALIGDNGAGKTTLAKHFNGLLRPHRGKVMVKHLDTREHTPGQLADYVGYLFQNPYLQICTGSVREEVGFALNVKKLPAPEIESRVNRLLDLLGLSDVADIHPYRLPRGLLQRVALASILVHEPQVLVADEPTSQMSYPRNWETMEFISRFNRDGGTVVLITHDWELARHFCTRVIFMDRGRITLDGTTSGLFEENTATLIPPISSASWDGEDKPMEDRKFRFL